MRIGILGSTELWTDGGEVLPSGGPGRRALLARLAVDAGRVVPVERLVNDVYDAGAPAYAANALQSQVSRIRSTLRSADSGHLLEFHSAGYRLALAPDDVDALLFERLAASGQRALTDGDPHTAATVLDEALGLWRGEALSDVGDAPFVTARTQSLNDTRLTATENRYAARLLIGDESNLVTPLQSLLSQHPLRERLRALTMRALASAGRPAEALSLFEEGRVLLADELGTTPSPELTDVHLAVLRGTVPSRTSFPHSPAPVIDEPLPTPPHPVVRATPPVPTPITRFVGDVTELDDLVTLLESERLVTLVGPSGVGKTRHALEVAARVSGAVSVAEFTAAGTDTEVIQVVLSALDIRTGGLGTSAGAPVEEPDDPMPRLVSALWGTATLLVFDNCEHVLDRVASLAHTLLTSCPTLRILATSQENLGVTGEVLRPVTPLALPETGTPAEAARDFAAIRLFADRAEAALPGFQVDEATVDDVVAICRTLDGLPLAIELAAARLRALPLTTVTERLADRFAVLTRGNRGAQPKHRTLRAAVSWSWDLLDLAEQRLARRFSVFSGGATLSAVEATCGGSEVGDVLAGLVEKSFLQVNGHRFRMLETIRTFAVERLADAGETAEVRSAHAHHYVALATEGERHLRGAGQTRWLRTLSPEQENMHAALRWAVEHDQVTALRLMAAATLHMWIRGQRHEWNAIGISLLRKVGEVPPPGLEEEYVLCTLNAMAAGPGAPGLAGEPLDRVAEIVSAMTHPRHWPILTVLWPTFYGGSHGDIPDLRRFVDACHASAEPWTSAIAQVARGYIHKHTADPTQAEPDLRQGTDRLRALGDLWGQTQGLAGLAALHLERGGSESTLTLTSEALALAEAIDAIEDVGELLCMRGEALTLLDRLHEADVEYRRAASYGRRAGSREIMVWARTGMARVARLRGDAAEARRLCDLAHDVMTEGSVGGPAWRQWFRVLVERYRIAEFEHGRRAAQRHALDLANDRSAPHILACVGAGEVLASALVTAGEPEHAALLLGITVAARGATDVIDIDGHNTAAAIRECLGEIAFPRMFTAGTTTSHEDIFPTVTELTEALRR